MTDAEIDARLAELGLELPEPAAPVAAYVPVVVAGGLAHVSGQLPFIEDVLNGATEWRLFRTTALSQLLVESFRRHFFISNPNLGSIKGPALILNSDLVHRTGVACPGRRAPGPPGAIEIIGPARRRVRRFRPTGAHRR